MEEIKVGEYVRTISGNIDKVDALIGMIENTVHLEKHKWQDIKNIVKHSPNIIDLIEERRLCKWRNSNRYRRKRFIFRLCR